jgi:hypothetical protein
MKALTCPKCGAPVEIDESSGAASFRCGFCGSTLAPTRTLGTAGAPVVIDLRLARRAGASAARWAALIFLVTMGFTGWIVWTSFRAATSGTGSALESISRAVETAGAQSKRWTLAELGGLEGGRGWVTLDLAPPPPATGGFAALDPVAALPWALTVAQSWRSDVALERIDVVRLRADGTVNVADDPEGEVMYRFLTPSGIAEWQRRAKLSTRAEADYELFVKLAAGRVTVLVVRGRPGDDGVPAYPARALPARELMPRLARDGRFAELPFFSGYLIALADEGWVWYLAPLSGGSLPRARAADGRIWPYR